jgi:rhomboid protease GluP
MSEERPSEEAGQEMVEEREVIDDPSPSEAPAYVTNALLAANFLLWIVSTALASRGNFRYELVNGLNTFGLEMVGGNRAGLTFGEGQWWRLISASFLHGGALHIAFNSYALFIYGPVLERAMGRGVFLLLYLLSGMGGFALSAAMNPRVVSVGASASIFGLVGALLALLRRRKAPADAVRSVLWVAAINFGIGLQPGSNIDNWGHGGGLIVGVVLCYALDSLSLRGVETWRRVDRASLHVSLGLLAYGIYGALGSVREFFSGARG